MERIYYVIDTFWQMFSNPLLNGVGLFPFTVPFLICFFPVVLLFVFLVPKHRMAAWQRSHPIHFSKNPIVYFVIAFGIPLLMDYLDYVFPEAANSLGPGFFRDYFLVGFWATMYGFVAIPSFWLGIFFLLRWFVMGLRRWRTNTVMHS